MHTWFRRREIADGLFIDFHGKTTLAMLFSFQISPSCYDFVWKKIVSWVILALLPRKTSIYGRYPVFNFLICL